MILNGESFKRFLPFHKSNSLVVSSSPYNWLESAKFFAINICCFADSVKGWWGVNFSVDTCRSETIDRMSAKVGWTAEKLSKGHFSMKIARLLPYNEIWNMFDNSTLYACRPESIGMFIARGHRLAPYSSVVSTCSLPHCKTVLVRRLHMYSAAIKNRKG